MAEVSECKHRKASAPFPAESLRLLSDAQLSSLWEQSHYGQLGELPYREWLRRTGYQDIARHLHNVYGITCAELTDLTMRERRRRQKLRYGRTTQ